MKASALTRGRLTATHNLSVEHLMKKLLPLVSLPDCALFVACGASVEELPRPSAPAPTPNAAQSPTIAGGHDDPDDASLRPLLPARDQRGEEQNGERQDAEAVS